MAKLKSVLLLSAGILSSTLAAQEYSHEQQLKLVQTKGCASCHGTKGQGNPYMKGPRLAGQSSDNLIKKLKGYRSGELKNPTMGVMSASLTDDEISGLAQYFSQFK